MSYAFTGDYWNKININYYINPALSYAADVVRAFERWDSLIGLDFFQVTNPTLADISVSQAVIDGFGGISGEAYWFTNGSGIISEAYVDFDTLDLFGPNDPDDAVYQVALHEIGHTIGLDHPMPSDPFVIMNAIIDTGLGDLQADDIAAARLLYGAESGWAVGWHLSWAVGWNVGWTYGWNYGWTYGWTYGWNVGWNYGWFNNGAGWELSWGYGWGINWHQAWHVGWNVNWYVGWNYGWYSEYDYGWYLE